MKEVRVSIQKAVEEKFNNKYKLQINNEIFLIDLKKMKATNEEYLNDNIIRVDPILEFFNCKEPINELVDKVKSII